MASPNELDAMRHAIALSALGLGTTSPNPPVGCVILDPEGHVAGTGHHRRKGEAHAETQALATAGARVRGGTAVVTLEPCNHVGLTPACRQALLDAKIARAVIGLIDPTSRGDGGAALLKAAGVDVEVGVLDDEVLMVLEPWRTATIRGWPYVTWTYTGTDMPATNHHHDLRYEVDVVLHSDGCAEEGVPGGHGIGMLQLPTPHWEPDDPANSLSALFQGGARTVLAIGDSPLARSLLDHGLVDRIVVDIPRDSSGATTSLPPGFRIGSVTATRACVRVSARRSDTEP